MEVQPGMRGEMWRELQVEEKWRCPVQSLHWYVTMNIGTCDDTNFIVE